MEWWELKQRQSLPLESKIILSKSRIQQWYEHWEGNVYVSFSGGKDSTVLLHLVRSIYPDVPAMFLDTGLEFPEIKEFVRTIENVDWVCPKMNFKKVIEKYGYPVISKEQSEYIYELRTSHSEILKKNRLYGSKKGRFHISNKWRYLLNAPFNISNKCCYVMKKGPANKYEKMTNRKPFVGTMADEGELRTHNYLRRGCNAFDGHRPRSAPLSFWTERDIWEYIKHFNVPYSRIYDMGYRRTGCMFCMYGIHLEPYPNRFQRMYYTHPKLWDYCIYKLGCGKVLNYLGIPYDPSGLTGLSGFFRDYIPTSPIEGLMK